MAFRSTCAAHCTGRISCWVRQDCSCLRWEEKKDTHINTQTSLAENNLATPNLKFGSLYKESSLHCCQLFVTSVKKKGEVQTYNHALKRLQILTPHTLTPHTPGPGPSELTYLLLTHLLVVERNMAPPSCCPPWLGSGVLWVS